MRSRSRGPRRATHPLISIVLVIEDDAAPLRSLAAPLVEECSRVQAELVAVRRGPSAEMLTLARAYPLARCVGAPVDATREQLRTLGFNEASGDIVAFVEDPRVVVPGWMDALCWRNPGAPQAPGQGAGNEEEPSLPAVNAERVAE